MNKPLIATGNTRLLVTSNNGIETFEVDMISFKGDDLQLNIGGTQLMVPARLYKIERTT